MRFCDFCECDRCVEGETGFCHATTEDGRRVCDVCWQYEFCLAQGADGPCVPGTCDHRPKLVSDWVFFEDDESMPSTKR